MWSRNYDGIVKEELYDVILEVAAYAKKHLEIGRSFQSKDLPKNTHRALILAVEADHFLKELEKQNFDVFDPVFRKKSVFRLPYEMHKAIKAGTF